MRTTCVATTVEAGHAENALPQRARANVNCRILPGDAADDVQKTIEKVLADPAIHVKQDGDIDVSAPSLPSADVMQAVGDRTSRCGRAWWSCRRCRRARPTAGSSARRASPLRRVGDLLRRRRPAGARQGRAARGEAARRGRGVPGPPGGAALWAAGDDRLGALHAAGPRRSCRGVWARHRDGRRLPGGRDHARRAAVPTPFAAMSPTARPSR